MRHGMMPAVTAEPGYVFSRAPRMIYWEMTRACDLACRHCRAEAIAHRDPLELTTAEARAMLDQIAGFGEPRPHVVCTGGDPLKRPDVLDVMAYGAGRGLGMSLAPSATANLTPEIIRALREAGMQSMSLSLDGATAERHDAFRGVAGCYDTTLQAARWVRDLEIPLQLNTLVTADTADDLPALYGLAEMLGVMRWSLFFLIPVGRGRALREITPLQAETVMQWMAEQAQEAPFAIAATEAPHFPRLALTSARSAGQTTAAVLDLYRGHEVFLALRDVDRLAGKCGVCDYRPVCGGSRARAFAHSGDYLGSDPLCAYQP